MASLLLAALGTLTYVWLAWRNERMASARLRRQIIESSLSPAYLSHEIRTPLTIIRASAEILATTEADGLTAAQLRFAQTIADNATAACTLADEFLVLFNMEKSLAHLELRKVELRAMMRQAISDFRIMYPADIRLDNHGAPIFIQADERMMKQVIWNLLTNAVRHGGEDPRITVRVTSNDGVALVVVGDSGTGFAHSPSEQLPLPDVGTPLADNVDGLPKSGSGIGVTVVRRTVEAHGGTLTIDTSQKVGAQIYIQLPIHGNSLQRSDEVTA